MAEYTGMFLTKKGRDLQVKAQSGVRLNFTKLAIGDGQHIQNIEDIETLLNPLKDLWISGIQVENGQCRIHSSITNQGITQGFYIREIGLYAQDPDIGEILYAIALASEADYLPAEGGATVVNNEFEIITVVANATEITANISNTGFPSREEFDKVVIRLEIVEARSKKNEEDISKMNLRLVNLEQSFFNNFTANHFTEDISTLNDVVVTRGVYDSVNKRLVV